MIRLLLLLALALAGLTPGCATPEEAPEAHELYTCGMHPQVVQEGPGQCPICGMDLTPLRDSAAAPGGLTDVHVEPGVILSTGVRTAPVRRQTIFRHLRTIGEVEVAESEISVVNLRFSGWVDRIFVDRTGDPVKAGQKLFEIYSPELVGAQEEYLLALRGEGADSPLARSARRKLELWDVSSADLDAIARGGEAWRTLPIRAPSSGFVLAKDIVEGARVMSGMDLYRIGNLSRIWVNAEVYEFDAPWVEEGQAAQMELSFQAGEVVEGRVAYIYPTLNDASRTLRVRLEFENPGIELKPGMFATVYIEYRRKDDALAIPTEAIIHSGKRELVFVALGQGRFAPREVTTGLVADHHMTEVLSGLEESDVVVTSGQFLLDSESQLQEAIGKLLATRAGTATADVEEAPAVWSCPMHPEVLQDDQGRCPKCGMFLEERPATPDELAALHAGHAHDSYTCPMHPEVVSDKAGKCPKCGMFLEKVEAAAADPDARAPGAEEPAP